ncbi:MAG: ORF6N domain-containing protein [Clostridiales bacterium]|nr:ORF6N domain-containing protein [Clostridiales bacterium]
MATEKNEVVTEEKADIAVAEAVQVDIRSLIYVVRGQQVMLDSDLAMLYQVKTKRLNESVKRNIVRFPKRFRFQLTEEETDSLRSQIATLNETSGRGAHRKYLPYVFTEQGIAMLSSVLRSDVAIQVSINIMDAFIEMRRFISNNAVMFERISAVELRQLQYQEQTDAKLEQIFDYISEHVESTQKVFFDGQIYDAFGLLVNLIQKAEKEITLIDGYVDVDTLNLLCKKNDKVSVTIHTHEKTKLSNADVVKFNAQYPTLVVKYTKAFHDRFLILDKKIAYHIGASLKDAGKKCFAVSLLQDEGVVKDILQRLKLETETEE